MKLSLIVALSVLTIASPRGDAQAKGSKAKPAATVHLCYTLSVMSGGQVTKASEECTDATIKSAQKAIDKCTSESAEVCEVIWYAETRTFTIERKITIKEGTK